MTPLALKKAETTREVFLQVFFYCLLKNKLQLNSNITSEKYLQFNQDEIFNIRLIVIVLKKITLFSFFCSLRYNLFQ